MEQLFTCLIELYKATLVDFSRLLRQYKHLKGGESSASPVAKLQEEAAISEIEQILLEYREVDIKSIDRKKFGPDHKYKIVRDSGNVFFYFATILF